MPDIHDLGGRAEYFAPIRREADEPVFHERWEARVAGMMAVVWAMLGKTNDRFRYDIERLPPQKYFSSYWARWLAALESELESDGYLADGELDAKISGQQRASIPHWSHGNNGHQQTTVYSDEPPSPHL
ncbi:MAG: hypothetical protein ACRDTN_21520, partial [Mycobacterium sp.]